MKHKYLNEAGIKEQDLPWNWNPEDDRQKQWKEDREKYGFDEREIWSLDYTIALLIYERLKMFDEIMTGFDKGSADVEFILETLKEYTTRNTGFVELELRKKIREAFKKLGEILPGLWW